MENFEKKIAIYCRVSTQQQTTDRQKEDLLEVAKRNGFEINEDFIFVDVISGFKLGEIRPQYQAMQSKVEAGQIKTILFSELSRLGRNATDLLKQVEYFQEKDVELYFEKQCRVQPQLQN